MKKPPKRPSPELPFLLEEADEEVTDKDAPEEDAALPTAAAPRRSAPPERPSPRAAASLPFGAGPTGSALEGAVVADYRLVSRLAIGGMSEVWLADALSGPFAGRTLVVKRLLPSLRGLPDFVERFRAEATLGASLSHPGLARAYALFEHGSDLFLSQELVGGETLSLLSAAARKALARLDPAAALHAVTGLVGVLEYLHGAPRLVHADVNPDNIVARPDGSVTLIDLGLAQRLSADGSVASPDGALRGTPSFMSPEQVKSRPLDARSDLFSACVVLWELLANRPLFSAETEFETLRRVRELPAPPLRAVWPEAPTVLERLLVRGLAKDPLQRFQSAAELADALHRASLREGMTDGQAALADEVARHAPRAPRADRR
jgi:serine/threonine protein kinase